MLNSSDHMRPCPRFAHTLTGIHAGLGEVYDWLHLYTTGLAPATFYQLAWRTQSRWRQDRSLQWSTTSLIPPSMDIQDSSQNAKEKHRSVRSADPSSLGQPASLELCLS